MDTQVLIVELEKTATELEGMAQTEKIASVADTQSEYINGLVQALGLDG